MTSRYEEGVAMVELDSKTGFLSVIGSFLGPSCSEQTRSCNWDLKETKNVTSSFWKRSRKTQSFLHFFRGQDDLV